MATLTVIFLPRIQRCANNCHLRITKMNHRHSPHTNKYKFTQAYFPRSCRVRSPIQKVQTKRRTSFSAEGMVMVIFASLHIALKICWTFTISCSVPRFRTQQRNATHTYIFEIGPQFIFQFLVFDWLRPIKLWQWKLEFTSVATMARIWGPMDQTGWLITISLLPTSLRPTNLNINHNNVAWINTVMVEQSKWCRWTCAAQRWARDSDGTKMWRGEKKVPIVNVCKGP